MRILPGKYVIAMTLTTALLGASGPSIAEETGKTVSYADLDLSNTADVIIVYERIQDAARMVCNDRTGNAPSTLTSVSGTPLMRPFRMSITSN